MKMMRIFFISLALIFLDVILFAGWIDAPPRPINSYANPGAVDPHANSGGRRIVRINNTTIAICPHLSGERTYRSTNNGVSWVEIDTDGSSSGCLISGPGETVYHFYIQGDCIYMVKFRYDATPPAPVCIYTHPDLSTTGTGAYRAVNASVNERGDLFVASHWGSADQLYVLRSVDSGISWDNPIQISSGTGPWFYPHLEVTTGNMLMCVYAHLNSPYDIRFAKSIDNGLTWTNVLVSHEQTSNPSILPVGDRRVLLFAQSSEDSHRGLVYALSEDTGTTWSGWRLIDPTCGYADPSPALESDGQTIYVAYRSSNGTGVTDGSCGDQCRSRLVMSSDSGSTWHFMDDYYDGERTGTRNQIRYQTWWNYGGPLEWIWMQYEDGGAERPIYYDVNTSVQIMNGDSEGDGGTSDNSSGGGGGLCFIRAVRLH